MNNEQLKDIEIALRNGLIEEMTRALETARDALAHALNIVQRQSTELVKWEQLAREATATATEATILMTAYKLECDTCPDQDHHDD